MKNRTQRTPVTRPSESRRHKSSCLAVTGNYYCWLGTNSGARPMTADHESDMVTAKRERIDCAGQHSGCTNVALPNAQTNGGDRLRLAWDAIWASRYRPRHAILAFCLPVRSQSPHCVAGTHATRLMYFCDVHYW